MNNYKDNNKILIFNSTPKYINKVEINEFHINLYLIINELLKQPKELLENKSITFEVIKDNESKVRYWTHNMEVSIFIIK